MSVPLKGRTIYPRYHPDSIAIYLLWRSTTYSGSIGIAFACKQRTIIRGSYNGELPWPLTDSVRAAVQRHVSEMIFCSRCTTGFHHTRLAMRLTASILFLVINCVHYVFCCLHLTHNTIAPICKVVNHKFVELIVAPLIVGVLLKLFEWWLTH